MVTVQTQGPWYAKKADNRIIYSLMISYLMLIVALQSTLYVWSSLVGVLFILWRFLYQQRKTSLPTSAVLNLLAVVCCLLVVVTSLKGGVLNSMTNLLLLATSMKLLAIRTSRGVRHLCLALYFTIASAFIFKQDMAFTFFIIVVFTINTYTLLTAHSPALNFKARSRYAVRFFLTSLPLILFLFALMPRFGPLWKMPSAKGSTTGLSEEITPGDFSSLAQSSKLAFRVKFDDDIPDNGQLYWRTMTHERFDGKQWKVDRFRKAPQNIAFAQPPAARISNPQLVSYQVIVEPTFQKWAYALDTPIAHSNKLQYQRDRRLTTKTPVTQKLQYEVTSALNHQAQNFIFELERQINLLQPKNKNPRAQQFARELRAQSASDVEFINKVMSYFNDNPFIYTLEPPLTPVDPVDTFLFETRAGFCAHYASAFASVMRAGGIPARLVSGFQGGERADGDTYLSVYQYEAHAWNEVWLSGRGWVRLDPTSVVSPERIALGLQASMGGDQNFLSGDVFNLAKYRHLAVLNWVHNQLNNIDFYWSSWILNFDTKKQSKLFESIWGKQDQAMYSLYSAFALSGFLLFIYFLSRGRLFSESHSDFYSQHQQLILLGLRHGFERPISMPPLTFIAELAEHSPSIATELDQLKACYQQCLYQDNDESSHQALIIDIKKHIKKLSRRAPRRFRGFGF